MSAILLRLDAKREPRPLWRVLFWFFLRLILAAALLYVSLKVWMGRSLLSSQGWHSQFSCC